MSRPYRIILLQVMLFVLTFFTTTLAGTEWVYGKSLFMGIFSINPEFTWADFALGLPYSLTLLSVLTVHEFGHYFTARHHGIETTLPWYIPLPPFLLLLGTMGAVIRLKSRIHSLKQNFDIGLAGPLAGFILAFGLLWYGFATLPTKDYVFQFHPDYAQYGTDFEQHVYDQPKPNVIDIVIGKNLLWLFFEKVVADPDRVPNPHEIMHYPILLGGFISLIFTFLNLLPFGQLDGGHILYGLVGYQRHRQIASVVYILFMGYAGIGVVAPGSSMETMVITFIIYSIMLFIAFTGLRLELRDTIMITLVVVALQMGLAWLVPGITGYQGWLLFGFIVGRFIGIPHPRTEIEEPLSSNRIALGWFTLLIFILSFSPQPIVMQVNLEAPPAENTEKMVKLEPQNNLRGELTTLPSIAATEPKEKH